LRENFKGHTLPVSSPHFFIIGAQRSGTTLLRLLLNNHSDVAIPNEGTFLMPLLRRQELLRSGSLSYSRKDEIVQYLLNNSQFAKWGIEQNTVEEILHKELTMKDMISFLYGSFASKYGKCICGDKSPTFIRKLGVLSKAYPNAKFIHIVRDGRDTFLSLKKMKAPGTSSVSLSAVEWKSKLLLIHNFAKDLKGRFIEIKYEDLVQGPHDELSKICSFLGISFQKRMFDFWKQSEGFIAKHHSDLIFKPIDPSNIFRWKNELSMLEAKQYAYFSKKALKRYSYEIPSDPLAIKEKAIYWIDFFAHLPKRIFRIIRIALFMRLASKFGLRVGPAYYD
jgi:Sulfotransferase family